MAVSRVWVSLVGGQVDRIFNNRKDAIAVDLAGGTVADWPKSVAIKTLREQIFLRCKDKCEFCGVRLDRQTGEMHEKHPRGELRHGNFGEYSMSNSVFLCRSCHTTGPAAAHSNRRWHSAKIGSF